MTAEVIIKGDRAGTSPGLRQPPEPEPGELRRTPVEIEGPYFRLGAPERSNLLEPGDKPELVLKAEGRYEFTCIIPGCYEPRGASHLHVKVQGDSQPITTQLYIEGVPGNEDDHYYSSELLVRTTKDANGTLHGTYDFVIKQVTEKENVTPESLAARV
jgi:hypothetical protein